MDQQDRHNMFFNYPEARKGPDVPYTIKRKQNPVLNGFFLIVAAHIVESIRFVREKVWHNAGFGSLRNIREFIEHYEPHFVPTVTPLRLSPEEAKTQGQRALISSLIQADARPQSPAVKLYSVEDYRALYLSGQVTPTDVAYAILPLVRRDTSPPGKHSTAWFQIKIDQILKAAEASTLRYKNNESLGLLDGIPTAVKDEYDMDGYITTLGSSIDYALPAAEGESSNSWLVRKLEETGAVILGKLHMHEFGLDTTGNNPLHGTPLNPYNPNYYTGGSSSGPGYAIATGIIPIALGSDGGGSIRIPSACCSVFGLKPSHARLTTWPGANHSPTCAVQGPMAVDMQSLAIMYEAIAEPHPSTQFPPLALQPAPPVTKVLGIYDAWISHAQPGIQALVRTMVDTLAMNHGYTIVPITIPFVAEGQVAHALTVLTDGATLLDDMSTITPANKILLALGRTTPSTDYMLAQKLRALIMQHLAYLWKTYPGMMIITPTMACAGWPIKGGRKELKYGLNDGSRTLESMEYVWLANFCGLPSLNVPVGYVVPEGSKNAGEVADKDTEGMVPIGMIATGEWCSEDALLRFGIDAEAAGKDRRRKPPIWEDIIDRAKTVAKINETIGYGVGGD